MMSIRKSLQISKYTGSRTESKILQISKYTGSRTESKIFQISKYTGSHTESNRISELSPTDTIHNYFDL